ncbi:MAG: hypothetical protein G01um101431_363 [Parcubacteria group bacterium Gr01-1014_31]|nr:MAG: hypothetical protein G01um101431_363 [Parcubacteria group bacterium Gr01-1014_31]
MPERFGLRWLTLSRLAWALAPLALLFWLAWVDLVPSAQLRAEGWPISGPYLRGPVPESRVEPLAPADIARGYRMLAEPVYVDLQQPRPFRTLSVQLELDPGNLQVVELGLIPDGRADHLTLQPAYHRVLEELSQPGRWTQLRGGGLVLLQREPDYENLDDFLRQPPEAERIAAYRVPFELPFTVDPLPPSGAASGTDFILTGYRPIGAPDGWRKIDQLFLLTTEQQSAASLRIVISAPERPLPSPSASFRTLRTSLLGDRVTWPVLRGWAGRWFR